MMRLRPIARGWWSRWQAGSVNQRILTAAITVSGFTVVVKLAAFAKELLVARQFGTSDAIDAFLIAFLLPAFFINIIAASFTSAIVPTFVQVEKEGGREAAQRFFSSIMVWSTVVLVAATIFLAVANPWILPVLGSGFNESKLELTTNLFYVLLPILLSNGLVLIWGGILNAGERFAFAALAPILTPLLTIVFLLELGDRWGVYALAGGTLAGFALEAVVLAWVLRKRGFSLWPRWYGVDPALRQVRREYGLMVAAAVLMSGASAVDQAMAAMLAPGSVASLNYGVKVVAMAIGVGSGIWIAVLPYFSKMVAAGDWSGLRHSLRTFSRLILLISVPVTILLVLLSEPLIGFLFERGAFTGQDTTLVAHIQALYALQLPFYILSLVLLRVFSALKANRWLMWASVLSFLLNVLLNYILMQWLGVSGIALSTSIVFMVSVLFLGTILRRLLDQAEASGAIIDEEPGPGTIERSSPVLDIDPRGR